MAERRKQTRERKRKEWWNAGRMDQARKGNIK